MSPTSRRRLNTSFRPQRVDATELRGLAERTQQRYVYVLAHLDGYHGCRPDPLDAAQVQAWLLHRITERHRAYATVNQAVCALKFFFGTVCGRESNAMTIPYARTLQRQPEILSRTELVRLFDAAGNLRVRTLRVADLDIATSHGTGSWPTAVRDARCRATLSSTHPPHRRRTTNSIRAPQGRG
jgi:hypothetical protein